MEIKVGGFLDLSTVDYPGKCSSVVFLHGCNFRCPFCFNPELVSGDQFKTMDTGIVKDFLLNNRELADAVVITGGEPTLQPTALKELCTMLKKEGMLIKLDTNGSNPDVLASLIVSGLIDYIAMDIKSDFAEYTDASGVAGITDNIKKSIDIIKSSGLPHEFRTTVVPKLHDKLRLSKMAAITKGSKHYLQQFRNEKTLDPTYTLEKGLTLDELQKIITNIKVENENIELRK